MKRHVSFSTSAAQNYMSSYGHIMCSSTIYQLDVLSCPPQGMNANLTQPKLLLFHILSCASATSIATDNTTTFSFFSFIQKCFF
jgi:hypothetical protein